MALTALKGDNCVIVNLKFSPVLCGMVSRVTTKGVVTFTENTTPMPTVCVASQNGSRKLHLSKVSRTPEVKSNGVSEFPDNCPSF